MSKKMGRAMVIKKYLEEGQTRPIQMAEMMEFKNACSPEEWNQFAKDAAEALGIELED